MEATLGGLAAVRVRDVEIALVLAREMKGAAERNVDASLRLEQLREVFGAETLDSAERARIQTALQMAGLEPTPSLLEADPAEPIRFAVDGAPPPAEVADEALAGEEAEAPEPPQGPQRGGSLGPAARGGGSRRAVDPRKGLLGGWGAAPGGGPRGGTRSPPRKGTSRSACRRSGLGSRSPSSRPTSPSSTSP